MPIRPIDPGRPGEDWQGNNIAITCPSCSTVYIVSQLIHGGERDCPTCRESTGRVTGGPGSGGNAEIEWRLSAD